MHLQRQTLIHYLLQIEKKYQCSEESEIHSVQVKKAYIISAKKT